jgi:hypothetical protein
MTEKTMDLTAFAEAAGKSDLPFIYAGGRQGRKSKTYAQSYKGERDEF